MAALAYPDRIALRRTGDAPRFLTSGGKGIYLADDDPLAAARLLVVTDTDGHPREARIRAALQISEAELREVFAPDITWQNSCHWSRRERRVMALEEERFGQLALQSRMWKDAPQENIARAMCDGIRELGLKPSPAAERLRARVALLTQAGHEMPDMSDTALLETLEVWLAPYLTGVKTDAQWKSFDIHSALQAQLTYEQTQLLAQHAPAHFTTPLGRQIPIDYAGDDPEISLRIQEMFGQRTHPKSQASLCASRSCRPPSAPCKPQWISPHSGIAPILMCAKTCVAAIPATRGPKTPATQTQRCVQNAAPERRLCNCRKKVVYAC